MRNRIFISRLKPAAMPPKDTLAHIDDLIRTAKGVWLGLLAYLAYIGVTLIGVEDADFFLIERQTDLPLIGVSIPTTLFFAISPALGAMVFVYLHQYLLKLWEGLAAAPAQIDKVPLGDAIAPWLVADFALSQRRDGAIRLRPMRVLSSVASVGLAFVAAPFVLAAFWWRSMPKHDEALTVIACGIPLAICIYAALASWVRLRRLARKNTALPLWGRGVTWALRLGFVALSGLGWMTTEGTLSHYAQKRIIPIFRKSQTSGAAAVWEQSFVIEENEGYAFAGYYFNFVSFFEQETRSLAREFVLNREKMIYSNEDPLLFQLKKMTTNQIALDIAIRELETRWWMKTWVPELLVSANLSKVVFVTTPADWLAYEEAEQVFRRKWCDDNGISPIACGAGPLGQDADGKKLYDSTALPYQRSLWCKQTYGPDTLSDRCNAEFVAMNNSYLAEWQMVRQETIAKLPVRDFRNIDLRGADLSGARMERVDLAGARMEGADLRGARLEGADLSRAWMQGADLSGARLEVANLLLARLERVKLIDARLEGADLILTRLEEADLAFARMEGSDLRYARIEWADLSNVRMDASTVLDGTTFMNSVIQSVNLSDVKISNIQIKSMFGSSSVSLPNGVTVNHSEWPVHWPRFERYDWEYQSEWRKWLQAPNVYVPPPYPKPLRRPYRNPPTQP